MVSQVLTIELQVITIGLAQLPQCSTKSYSRMKVSEFRNVFEKYFLNIKMISKNSWLVTMTMHMSSLWLTLDYCSIG